MVVMLDCIEPALKAKMVRAQNIRPPGAVMVTVMVAVMVAAAVLVVVVVALLLAAPRLLDRHHPSPLFRQLHPRLRVTVEEGKVGHNDRYGERDHKNAGEGAQAAHNEPGVGLRDHIAVTHGGHCHDGPPQALRDALEIVLGVGVQAFRIVD